MTDWVTPGLVLYLQNASSGDPTSAANTLAISTVDLQPTIQHYVAFYKQQTVQLNSSDSGPMLGTIDLPLGVKAADIKTSPDGTLLYAAATDGNIYAIDPSTLTITAAIELGTDFVGGRPFVWIKNQQGKDLILTAPDTTDGNISVVDPAVGAVTSTIVCGCPYPVLVYDPFNQTTYVFSTVSTPNASLTLNTVDSNLNFGSINIPLPLLSGASTSNTVVSTVIPLANLYDTLLIQYVGPYGQDPPYLYPTVLYQVTTGTVVGVVADLYTSVPLISSFGQSVYTQQATAVQTVIDQGPGYGYFSEFLYELGPVTLNQISDGIWAQMATASLPAPDVLSPPVAFDGTFVYLENQAAIFTGMVTADNYYTGYVPQGPIYIYKADPNTLQPVGPTTLINTGIEVSGFNNGSIDVGPVAADSYVFTGCANTQTGSFCSP